ncbi:MAG: polyphosphate polymerase domain-containing protein [Bacteroidales bacterium]|nr:polyphosphate polymerase domain-containing protein [Bacteroidales bacterium]MDT8372947.1 polyphosphate polymerase domain-containing protein [Bacteroidales bacterium]
MTKLNDILQGFEPVGLDGTYNVRYMNRVDTKYLFPVSKLPLLLRSVRSVYSALEIDNEREFCYKTVYFDTPDLVFYLQHVTGKLNRTKVRVRSYESNGLTFLEVKQKSNKGRTSKTRQEKEKVMDGMDHLEESHEFLEELISADSTSLKPVLNTGFTRITLVNLQHAERITVDYNITWNNLKGECLKMPYLAIAEIKSEKSTALSPFFMQLKSQGIRSTGFSKYVTGMALLNGATKQNNIKPKFLLLNRIRDEFYRNGTA